MSIAGYLSAGKPVSRMPKKSGDDLDTKAWRIMTRCCARTAGYEASAASEAFGEVISSRSHDAACGSNPDRGRS
jgi:hypothetical protein